MPAVSMCHVPLRAYQPDTTGKTGGAFSGIDQLKKKVDSRNRLPKSGQDRGQRAR